MSGGNIDRIVNRYQNLISDLMKKNNSNNVEETLNSEKQEVIIFKYNKSDPILKDLFFINSYINSQEEQFIFINKTNHIFYIAKQAVKKNNKDKNV